MLEHEITEALQPAAPNRRPGIGLALSGGGFRATLFHVGVLWRLNEFGLLSRIDRISSVSGGSITAGLLARRWKDLKFQDGIALVYPTEVAEPLLKFTKRHLDALAILKSAVTPFRSIGDYMTTAYRGLVQNVTLQDLPDHPRFVFNATNETTGANWRFAKSYSGDYRLGIIQDPAANRFPLARVIAASAAFPPLLSPVQFVLEPASFVRTRGADLYDTVAYRTRLVCIDGGVYDNMGLEPVWKQYQTLLVADAGGAAAITMGTWTFWINQLVRAYNLTIEQDRDLRRRVLLDLYERKEIDGVYWYMPWTIGRFGVSGSLPVHDSWPARLSALPTRLTKFSDSDRYALINWGYAQTDAAIRRWYQPFSQAPRWPYPDYALNS